MCRNDSETYFLDETTCTIPLQHRRRQKVFGLLVFRQPFLVRSTETKFKIPRMLLKSLLRLVAFYVVSSIRTWLFLEKKEEKDQALSPK